MLNNKCIFVGRLTKDVEMSSSNDGNTVIGKFSIAIDNGKDSNGRKLDATYVQLKAFNKVAETINKFACKGTLIGVEAKLTNANYQKDGKTVYRDDFIVQEFQFFGGMRSNSNDNQSSQQQGQYNNPPQQQGGYYNNQPPQQYTNAQQGQQGYTQNSAPYQQNAGSYSQNNQSQQYNYNNAPYQQNTGGGYYNTAPQGQGQGYSGEPSDDLPF